jgi:thymidylate kinase
MTSKMVKDHPISRLINLCDQIGLRTVVWKGSTKLKSVFDGVEDLDLLVEMNSEFTSLAAKIGFFEVVKPWFKSDMGLKDYIYFDTDGVCFHVHVHYILLFGGSVERNYCYPKENIFLDNRLWNDEFCVWEIPEIVDVNLFLKRHVVRKKFGLHTNFAEEFNSLVSRKSLEISSFDIKAKDKEFSQMKLRGLSDIGKISQIRSLVKKHLSYFNISKGYFHNFIVFLNLCVDKMRVKLDILNNSSRRLNFGGIVVSFVGIDGSGKTTAIKRLRDKICSNIGVEIVTFGSGQSGAGFLRRCIFALVGSKASLTGHKKVRSKVLTKESKVIFPLYYKLWIFLCLMEKKKALKKYFSAKMKGKIVLVDRWLQSNRPDALDYPRLGNMKIRTSFDKFLFEFEAEIYSIFDYLSPDLRIVLDVSPDVSVVRKPHDLTLEQAIFARDELLSIAWPAKYTQIINADNSVIQVDEQILDSINKTLTNNQPSERNSS